MTKVAQDVDITNGYTSTQGWHQEIFDRGLTIDVGTGAIEGKCLPHTFHRLGQSALMKPGCPL